MSFFFSYLKQQLKYILLFLMFSAVFFITFFLYGFPLAAVAYPAFLCLLLGCIFFLWDGLRTKARHDKLDELAKLNKDGTTVMLVTHDVKVAAKCTRVMYIVDGNIKGEYNLDKYENSSQMRERERALNNWLLELGW